MSPQGKGQRAKGKGKSAEGNGLAVLGAVSIACAIVGSAQSLPNSPGKDTFESVCSLCHDAPAAVMGKQWSRAQWDAKVTEMLQEEPDVTAQERAAIVEYLAANFKPGGKIYINKASAKDLETLLDLSPAEADALVRYRTGHGAFKTVADLEKALDTAAAKIAARKDRLQFAD